MQFTEKRIEELRRLYKESYGQEITVEDARDMARRLVELYRVLLKPLPGSGEQASSGEGALAQTAQ